MLVMSSARSASGAEATFLDVVPFILIAGLFLSNFPEAPSSSSTMLDQGTKRERIFLMCLSLMVMTAVGAGVGCLVAGSLAAVAFKLLE